MPTDFKAVAAATISASGVDVETLVCRFDTAWIGNEVLGPAQLKKTPDVLRDEFGQSAKLASAYK
jgi:hypothetical protein